jgi:hypothetical protein
MSILNANQSLVVDQTASESITRRISSPLLPIDDNIKKKAYEINTNTNSTRLSKKSRKLNLTHHHSKLITKTIYPKSVITKKKSFSLKSKNSFRTKKLSEQFRKMKMLSTFNSSRPKHHHSNTYGHGGGGGGALKHQLVTDVINNQFYHHQLNPTHHQYSHVQPNVNNTVNSFSNVNSNVISANRPMQRFNQQKAQSQTAMRFNRFRKSKSVKLNNTNSISGVAGCTGPSSAQTNNPNKHHNFGHHNQWYSIGGNQQQLQHPQMTNNPNQLAHILRNELTINLTKNEPRLVIYNNANKLSQNKFHASNPIPIQRQTSNNANNQFRFKYQNSNANGQSNKNNAPYNTTQYIMFDYSRRTSECQMNEHQQFSQEWNIALAEAEAAAAVEQQNLDKTNTGCARSSKSNFYFDIIKCNNQLDAQNEKLDTVTNTSNTCAISKTDFNNDDELMNCDDLLLPTSHQKAEQVNNFNKNCDENCMNEKEEEKEELLLSSSFTSSLSNNNNHNENNSNNTDKLYSYSL